MSADTVLFMIVGGAFGWYWGWIRGIDHRLARLEARHSQGMDEND